MPDFSVDDIDVSVDEFLSECSRQEIGEVIEWLIDEEKLPTSVRGYSSKKRGHQISATEQMFEEHLSALQGKWNLLTSFEEETIMNIAKRFHP